MTMAMVVMMMILQGDILRKACYQINLTPLALHYTSPSFQPNLHLQTTDLGIKTESNIQMTGQTSIRNPTFVQKRNVKACKYNSLYIQRAGTKRQKDKNIQSPKFSHLEFILHPLVCAAESTIPV